MSKKSAQPANARLGAFLSSNELAVLEEFRVRSDVVLPLRRHFFVFEDCLNRALRFTRTARDALVRVDVELDLVTELSAEAFFAACVACSADFVQRYRTVDAVYGANVNACGIAYTLTGLGNDVDHPKALNVGRSQDKSEKPRV